MGGARNETEALALYQRATARGIPEAAQRLADAAEWRQKAAGMERRGR